jgi:hypothetical protein
LNNNYIIDNKLKKLFKKQFQHLQLNQLIILEIYKNNFIYLDFYNSFTTQPFYNNNINYLISNHTLNNDEQKQYINNNGICFVYHNLQDYLKNNLLCIDNDRILDVNYTDYFIENKQKIIKIMGENHYNPKIDCLSSLDNINNMKIKSINLLI